MFMLRVIRFQEVYIIRCLLLKYRLIFLQVLKVFDEPLGELNAERREKYQPLFQKKAPNNIFIVNQKFYSWGKNFGVQILWEKLRFPRK